MTDLTKLTLKDAVEGLKADFGFLMKNPPPARLIQPELGGGALLELSHELDYLQWFLGPLHLRYACNRQSGLLQLDVEDISELLLESADRTSCFVHLDFIQQAPSRHCSLIGAKGRIDWDFINNSVTLRLHNQQHLLLSASQLR